MKKISMILSLLLLFMQIVLAQQPTQADLEKMMKQAQDEMKKYSKDTTVNKIMKNLQDQQKQVSDGMNNSTTNNTSGSFLDPSDYNNVDNWKFPPKNTVLLSSLPKKIFTKTELVSFLNDTYVQLSKKLPAEINTSVQSIAAKYNQNNAGKMGDVAVTGWYTNYREESLLLIIKAAANNPDDGLLLNNCAAILEMSGIEQDAIPILKYLLQFNPGSGMVLNNLGQAYTGLGATDTAMVYFGSCMKAEPKNPEACNTIAQIEAVKGNTQKAIEYFEQSIKSAYTKPAALKLSKIKKDAKIDPLVRPRVNIPEYFNQFKYQLPQQCTSTDNALEADAEYAAFRAMISQQLSVYGGKIAELGQSTYQQYMQGQSGAPSHILKKDDFMKQPFYGLCSKMAHDIYDDYNNDRLDIGQRVDKKYFADLKVLTDEYNQKYKKMMDDFDKRCPGGEGSNNSNCPTEEEVCNAQNALANSYLPQFATLTQDWQEKNKSVFNKYFDELVYWHYLSLHPTGDDNFKRMYYVFITDYLNMLGKVAVTNAVTEFIGPCKGEHITKTKDPNAINNMDCPLDITIPLVVAKVELNCDKFSISGGEGVVFGYEKDFKTKQSTLTVGIGVKLELEAKLGPLKAGASVEATETAFITVDGNNGFSDAGIKNEATLSAGATGVGKKEVSVGSTLGINSGWNFNEGPFKGLIGSLK